MAVDEIQNNKLLLIGKLSASLLHEIRNPLSAIQCNVEYLKMLENELSEDALESVHSSSQALSRINYLVETFLDFTRVGQQELEDVRIETVTQKAISSVSGKAGKQGVSFSASFDNKIPDIRYNSMRLLQIFLNLITNALDVSVNGDVIRINSYLDENDRLIWEVKDNGPGIPPEIQNKIFSDFFTSKHNGTGLGLSVCKMLLDEINSEIYFNSENGNGTIFKVRFNPNILVNGYSNAANINN